MSDWSTIMTTVWSYFMTPLTIYGYTFTYGAVYIWTIIAGAVVVALKHFILGE